MLYLKRVLIDSVRRSLFCDQGKDYGIFFDLLLELFRASDVKGLDLSFLTLFPFSTLHFTSASSFGGRGTILILLPLKLNVHVLDRPYNVTSQLYIQGRLSMMWPTSIAP